LYIEKITRYLKNENRNPVVANRYRQDGKFIFLGKKSAQDNGTNRQRLPQTIQQLFLTIDINKGYLKREPVVANRYRQDGKFIFLGKKISSRQRYKSTKVTSNENPLLQTDIAKTASLFFGKKNSPSRRYKSTKVTSNENPLLQTDIARPNPKKFLMKMIKLLKKLRFRLPLSCETIRHKLHILIQKQKWLPIRPRRVGSS
jgi:hypothetical protein